MKYDFILQKYFIQIGDCVKRQNWTRQDITVSEPSSCETIQVKFWNTQIPPVVEVGKVLVSIYIMLSTIISTK